MLTPVTAIPRKLRDRRKDGRKNGQILFYRTLTIEAGGPVFSYYFRGRCKSKSHNKCSLITFRV